jgi:DNA-directed RNA polymerase specialized sigma24 family protein
MVAFLRNYLRPARPTQRRAHQMQNHTSEHQVFPPTQWSVVLSARDVESEIRSRALEHICQSYWHPIYAYARKRGFSPHDAEDVTQGFLATLIETEAFQHVESQHGKLRTYLLVSLRNFMANEWKRRNTVKRGGHATVLSIDLEDAEQRTCLEPADHLTPEAVFERHWATTLLNTIMLRLQAGRIQLASATGIGRGADVW